MHLEMTTESANSEDLGLGFNDDPQVMTVEDWLQNMDGQHLKPHESQPGINLPLPVGCIQ